MGVHITRSTVCWGLDWGPSSWETPIYEPGFILGFGECNCVFLVRAASMVWVYMCMVRMLLSRPHVTQLARYANPSGAQRVQSIPPCLELLDLRFGLGPLTGLGILQSG